MTCFARPFWEEILASSFFLGAKNIWDTLNSEIELVFSIRATLEATQSEKLVFARQLLFPGGSIAWRLFFPTSTCSILILSLHAIHHFVTACSAGKRIGSLKSSRSRCSLTFSTIWIPVIDKGFDCDKHRWALESSWKVSWPWLYDKAGSIHCQ